MENKPDVQGIRFCITTVHEPKGFLFGLKSTSDCFVDSGEGREAHDDRGGDQRPRQGDRDGELEIGVADRRLNQLLSEHRRHQLLDILEFDEYKEVNKEKAVEIEGAEVKRARAGNSFPCWQWRATCHL